MNWDTSLLYWLNSFVGQSSAIDTLLVFVADRLDVIVIIIAYVMLIGFHDPFPQKPFSSWVEVRARLKGLVLVTTSGAIAWTISHVLKYFFAEPRPYLVFNDITALIQYGRIDSFPSGHATFFSALAVALYFYNKKVGIFFGILAFVVGLARVVIGIHFPVDIIFGFVLGALVSYGTLRFYRYLKKQFIMDEWLKHLSL